VSYSVVYGSEGRVLFLNNGVHTGWNGRTF
jgi:hypothetical protein